MNPCSLASINTFQYWWPCIEASFRQKKRMKSQENFQGCIYFLLALSTRIIFLLLVVICFWLKWFFFSKVPGNNFFLRKIFIPGASWRVSGKDSACKCRTLGFNPWSEKTPTCLGTAKLVCCWFRVLEPTFHSKRSHYKHKLTKHT